MDTLTHTVQVDSRDRDPNESANNYVMYMTENLLSKLKRSLFVISRCQTVLIMSLMEKIHLTLMLYQQGWLL